MTKHTTNDVSNVPEACEDVNEIADRIDKALTEHDDPSSVIIALTERLAHWVSCHPKIDDGSSLDFCAEMLMDKVRVYRSIFDILEALGAKNGN